MRIKIREYIPTDSKPNIVKMSIWERIDFIFRLKLKEVFETEKKKLIKEEAKTIAEVDLEENLEDTILELLRINLEEPTEIKCKSCFIAIARHHKERLAFIQHSKDLLKYDIIIHDCDLDLVRCFKDIPIVLEASLNKKEVKGSVIEK